MDFRHKNIEIVWKGSGVDEIGYDKSTNTKRIMVNKKYFRPCEVDILLGDCTKIRYVLGWKPDIKFDQLVKKMVDFDCSV